MSTTGFLLVFVTAALTMAGNLLLRVGINRAGGFSGGGVTEIVHGLFTLFMQPLFGIGFILYFFASVVWFRVVATEPLSQAYPVLVSCTFTMVTAGAVVVFSERLSVQQVVGLGVILAGIALISAGGASPA